MTRRSKIWMVVALIFTILNLAGAGYAVAQGELLHACLHVVLLVLGAYAVGRIAAKQVASY